MNRLPSFKKKDCVVIAFGYVTIITWDESIKKKKKQYWSFAIMTIYFYDDDSFIYFWMMKSQWHCHSADRWEKIRVKLLSLYKCLWLVSVIYDKQLGVVLFMRLLITSLFFSLSFISHPNPFYWFVRFMLRLFRRRPFNR